MIVTAVALVAAMLVAVSNGTLEISPLTTLGAIIKGASGAKLEGMASIVWDLRLPRVAMGALVGATLAASGAAMQGLFRNPLADPYLTGVSSGAALGATVAITLTAGLAPGFAAGVMQSASASSLVPAFAFAGALLAMLATLLLAQTGPGRPASNAGGNGIILAGVVVGSLLTAATTYLMLRDADRLRAVVSWTLGNLALSGWYEVLRVLPYAVCGLIALLLLSRALDALQLGEDTAQTLGLRVEWIKLMVIAASSLATAAAVSFVGIIGFVGLVAPHLMRLLAGPVHRQLIPASALAGATLLVLADLGARTLTKPQELPVGVVTTLIGGPFFLWLLRRRSHA